MIAYDYKLFNRYGGWNSSTGLRMLIGYVGMLIDTGLIDAGMLVDTACY